MDCSHARIASTIKMAILNHANRLPLNLENGKSVTWNYYIFFDYDGKDVLYVLICNNCDYFYLGKTIDFKQRIRKHKSDVKLPQNNTCRECAEHLRVCAKIESLFQIHLFYHEKDHYLWDYKEKRFIIKWKIPSNINKTLLLYYFIFNEYLSDNRNSFILLQFNFKRFVKHF